MIEKTSLVVPIIPPWDAALLEAVRKTHHQLFIISPYIKKEVINILQETLLSRQKAQQTPLEIRVITRVLAEDFLSGSSDIAALQHILRWPMELSGSVVQIRAINNVHAKVWLFDDSLAIVGSGNATPSGLAGNLEYGLAVSEPQLVARILQDWNGWWEQAEPIEEQQLVQMYYWLEQGSGIQQTFEAQKQEQRKKLEIQIGRPPRLGKRLVLHSTIQKSPSRNTSSHLAEMPYIYESDFTNSAPEISVIQTTANIITITLNRAQLRSALSWVFPEIDEEEKQPQGARTFVKLSWKGTLENEQQLHCIWANGKRLSLATVAGHDNGARSAWTMTIDTTQIRLLQNTLGSGNNQHTDQEEILLHFSEKAGVGSFNLATRYTKEMLFKQEITGMLTSPPSPFPLPEHPIASFTVEHQQLVAMLKEMMQIYNPLPRIIQMHPITNMPETPLLFITGPTGPSPFAAVTVPTIQGTHFDQHIDFCLDSRSLQEIMHNVQGLVTTWQLSIDSDEEQLHFIPEAGNQIALSWKHLLWYSEY